MKKNETLIFNKLNKWSVDLKILEQDLETDSKLAELGSSKYFLKFYRKRDFLKVFVTICFLASKNIEDRNSRLFYIKDIIGSVIGDIIYETENIAKLRVILKSIDRLQLRMWIKDRKAGRIWLIDTDIDKNIEIITDNLFRMECNEDNDCNNIKLSEKLELSLIDYAKYELALFSGVSFSEVESMIARGLSNTYLSNIFYGQILFNILMDALGDDLYVSLFGDEKLFRGKESGINYFFDGLAIFEDNDQRNPWLVKCISTYFNPFDAIESIDSKMDDIGVKKCTLFLPMYPSRKALRYFVYAFAKKQHMILTFYLYELYEIIRIKSDKDIKDYFRGKIIS